MHVKQHDASKSRSLATPTLLFTSSSTHGRTPVRHRHPPPDGHKACPAFKVTCHHCNKVGHFAKVCKSRQTPVPIPPPAKNAHEPRSNLIRIEKVSPSSTESPWILSNVTDPAPTINVHISALNGSATVTALPDSGADISVAGPDIIAILGEHCNNLLLSDMVPRGLTGHWMTPIGQPPVSITLGAVTYSETLQVYPAVEGVLLS